MTVFRRVYMPAILAVLTAVLLLASASSTKSFWEDESWTVNTAQLSLDGILATDRHVHPPLHYLAAAGWFHLAGRSEIAMRWMSISCIAIAVSLGLVLMRRWFGTRAALAFALLIPAWPLLMVYGNTVRYYAWTTMLAMLALFFADNHARTSQVRWLLGYALCGAAMLYSVYASVVFLAGLWLWWLLRRRAGSNVLPWLSAHVLIALAFIPILGTFGGAVQTNVPPFSAATFVRELVSRGALLIYSFFAGETTSPLDPLAWLKILAIAAVFGLALGLRRVRRTGWQLLLMLIGIGAAALLVSAASSNNPSPQNITNRSLFFLPLFVMALSVCLSALPKLPQLALAGVILLTNAYSAANYYTNRAFFKPLFTVPWNQIMQRVAQASQTNGPIVLMCNSVDYACIYYGQVYGLQPLYPADWAKVAAQLPAQVWWVNSNITTRAPDVDLQTRTAIEQVYGPPQETNYAPQDPSIMVFKQRFSDGDVYAYRVNVWHFTRR